MEEFLKLAEDKGFSRIEVEERLSFFGGFKVNS